jgi:hypothetical protein
MNSNITYVDKYDREIKIIKNWITMNKWHDTECYFQ